MIELSPLQAAKYLGCSLRWLDMLIRDEILSSCCIDELEIYKEKKAIIHNQILYNQLYNLWVLDNYI